MGIASPLFLIQTDDLYLNIFVHHFLQILTDTMDWVPNMTSYLHCFWFGQTTKPDPVQVPIITQTHWFLSIASLQQCNTVTMQAVAGQVSGPRWRKSFSGNVGAHQQETKSPCEPERVVPGQDQVQAVKLTRTPTALTDGCITYYCAK